MQLTLGIYVTGKIIVPCPNLQIMLNSKIGQILVRCHAHQTFKLKYLTNYRVLKILNENTLLLGTPNGKECKMNINDMKLCTILELVENAWKSFLNSIKPNHSSHEYGPRPCDDSNMYTNSITATNLPTCITHLHQPLDL